MNVLAFSLAADKKKLGEVTTYRNVDVEPVETPPSICQKEKENTFLFFKN